MDGLRQDLRFAFRTLAARPGLTVVAVLTLALGIGGATAIVSVADATLMRALPYPDDDELVLLWLDNERLGIRTDVTSYPGYRDWRDGAEGLENLAGFRPRHANLTGEGEPERLEVALAGEGFFSILGVDAALGRTFLPEEDVEGNDRVVVLSHRLWQRRFGGDDAVLERDLRLDGELHRVVGVMPPDFDFPPGTELWGPLAPPESLRESRGSLWLYTLGRLEDGATVLGLQAEMSALAARQAEADPGMKGYGVYVQPLREHLLGDARPAILVLLGAVAFVLLIACANVANLLLARAAEREREISLRLALGAGRGRLIRQLLTESALLAFAGAAAGIAVAWGGVRLLLTLGPETLSRAGEVTVDGRALLASLALALLVGVGVGLVPALQASRPNLVDALKEGGQGNVGGRKGRRLRGALVVAEVALALVLLIGAGLLIKSFARLLEVDPGFEPRGVLTVDLALVGEGYAGEDRETRRRAFLDRLLERLEALPRVEDVAAGSEVLLPQLANSGQISVEGRPNPPPEQRIEVPFSTVTPGFFQALRIPLLAGRDVGPEDGPEGLQVAVINRAMAERYWPGKDAVGKRFKYGDHDDDNPWMTVVGVVGDARRTAAESEARPSCFVPYGQFPTARMTLVARAGERPLSLVPEIRAAVRELDADLPLAGVSTLVEQLGDRQQQRRFNTVLLATFATLALFLALVGLYGVIAYSVSQSTRELGVRSALGAGRARIVALVLRRGLALVAVGLALGLLAALALTRSLGSMLYAVGTLDPLTFLAVPLLLVLVAVLATLVPARRAARVAPTEALRHE